MKRLVLLLLISNSLSSQEYISLADEKVYDIEVIVFAYETLLPSPENYSNSTEIDTSESKQLEFKLEDTPYIKIPEIIESDELTLPIDGETGTSKQALVWFEHEESHFTMIDLWEKLSKTENIRPLVHKSWRQPETPFNNPIYVALNNKEIDTEEFLDTDIDRELNTDNVIVYDQASDSPTTEDGPSLYQLENTLKEDYYVQGQMALSKGRYLHFGNQLNFYRTFQKLEETRNMVFALTERKQVKPDEIQYFDNPWFGVIVKVTEYLGEPDVENETKESEANE